MPTRYRIVTETCVECAACVEVCPFAAISEGPYTINPELCNGCGECTESCPVEAIEPYEWSPPPPVNPLIVPILGIYISLTLKE
jgi:MinD superfamily P-loop ATPase